LRRGSRNQSLFRLDLLFGTSRLASLRCTSGCVRPRAIIGKECKRGKPAILRKDHFASFDLTDLPSVDFVPDLCAQHLLVGARAHNRARVLAVHDDTEENQVWRWRRGGWRGDLYDWRRRRRRWRRRFATGRKERTIKRRRQLVQRLSGSRCCRCTY